MPVIANIPVPIVECGTGDVIIALASPSQHDTGREYDKTKCNEIVFLQSANETNPIGDSTAEGERTLTCDHEGQCIRVNFANPASLRVLIEQAEELERRMLANAEGK